MKGWIKYFIDGTNERGADRAVRLKEASWRRGRLDNIKRVEAWHDRFVVAIDGHGEYWQSDDWEVPLYSNQSRVICRRIQKLISPADRVIGIYATPFKLKAWVQVQSSMYTMPPAPQKTILIDQSTRGKWLTLEMDVSTGEMRMRFSEKRI